MKSKILFSIIFLTLLIGYVSALESQESYAWFGNNEDDDSVTINLGDDIQFHAVFTLTSTEGNSPIEDILIDSSLILSQHSCSQSGNSYTKVLTCDYQVVSTKSKTFKMTTNAGEVLLTLTVNPAPTSTDTTAPIITSSPVLTVIEGNSYTYQIVASDENALTYSLTQKTTLQWLSINSATGLISGTAPLVNSNEENRITVTVSDGKNSVSQSFTLTILDSALIPDTTAPVITLIGDNPQIFELGSSYTELGATATDNVDGDLTSRINTTSNVNSLIVGTYTVVYTVSDSAGNSDSETRTVNVRDTTAPVIESIDDDSVLEGKEYKYQVEVTDFSKLNYSISGAEWLDIDEDGWISGTKDSVSSNKDYEITVTVTDEYGNSNSVTFTLTVKNKKSSGGSGGAGSVTTSTIKDETIPSTNIVIPQTITTKNKIDAKSILFYFMIATTTMGIIVVSLILFKKIKEIKDSKNKKQVQVYQPTQNQDSPYY